MGKAYDEEDPMALMGLAVPDGDADLMAECLVDEFARMGYDAEALLGLFRNPFYAGAHAIYRRQGEAYVRSIVERVRGRWTTGSTGGTHA
ncbi:MAG: hypothetical protein ACHQ9S_24915 [Candidatus Binatia bacterium]